MVKNLTKEQWEARAEAYQEAATHLDQSWTDDPVERAQGDKVAVRLRDIAMKCWERADAISRVDR